MHTRRIRDTDNRQLVGHHVAQRRLDRREPTPQDPTFVHRPRRTTALPISLCMGSSQADGPERSNFVI
ncbi:unnamed protein product [Cercopithifilaria johnstoni]|uniref:Uncharacterized protein n=1 Tax=Cercopithifilaria johnstoni TaxID=2874296 RepID=A0A8J2M9D8_9BILA|nr:unnamed protein product [Cercopithifilaria johnstoni]